jgi:hypothetical protein
MTTVHSEAPTLVGDNSLAAELLARRRKRLPAMTLALVILVAAALAFVGGIEAQRHWGTSTSSTTAASSAFAARFGARTAGGGAPTFGAGGFGGVAGGGTTGTVTLIKGSTLYVTDSSGNTVLVHTTAGTRVSKTAAGTVKSIHPGDTVTVTGTPGSNGSTNARQVTIGGGNG